MREVIEHQIGDYPENWVSEEVKLKDLTPNQFGYNAFGLQNEIKRDMFDYIKAYKEKYL